MKNPPRLQVALAYFAASFVLIMFAMLGYSVGVEGEPLSTLTYLPVGVAAVAIVVIMSMTKPEHLRSNSEWPHFLWALPTTYVVLGSAGYVIMGWLYGDTTAPIAEWASWGVLAACAVVGLSIAWYRGRSFKWPEAGE